MEADSRGFSASAALVLCQGHTSRACCLALVTAMRGNSLIPFTLHFHLSYVCLHLLLHSCQTTVFFSVYILKASLSNLQDKHDLLIVWS